MESARCYCCLLRDLMSFSFSCSDWERAALAAASFFNSCRRHRKSITTAGFAASELAAVALGEEGRSS